MTAVDVEFDEGLVCTVTIYGWTGPDDSLVKCLNEVYPASCPDANNVVIWVAKQVVNEFVAKIIAIREIPDPDGEPEDHDASFEGDSDEDNTSESEAESTDR